ncbi:MAG: DinB family protein [Dehalococcoidia bacterium]
MTSLGDHFRLLYDYTCWANNRAVDLAGQVPLEEYRRSRPYGRGSLRDVLTHSYTAEWRWRQRFEHGGQWGDPPGSETLDTPAALARDWAEEQGRWRTFLASADLDQPIDYSRSDGVAFSNRLGDLIAHVFNHSTQHRAEAAWLLTELGASPGDLDLIVYLRAQQ